MPTALPIEGVAWSDLAVLLAAIREGSLSGAARTLRIGQSTASRRLARLEERLGARLFDRTPDGLQPTQFALDLEPHARLIEGHMADVERLAAGQEAAPSGRIRLAAPDGLASFWLMPALASFFERYPAVEIDCMIGPAVVDLTRRAADIALRFVPPTAPDLVVRRMGRFAVAPYAHPSIATADPRTQRWIMLADPERLYPESRWIDAHIQPPQTMTVTMWHALLAAVREGLGVALLSPRVAEQFGLVRVLTDAPALPTHPLLLVYHRAMRDVPRIAAFREWLIETAAALDPTPLDA